MPTLDNKRENLSKQIATHSKRLHGLGYEINYSDGENSGCSSKLIIADRIFYVKLFESAPSRFFSGDQQGIIQKEISKSEFDLWVNILADDQTQAAEIQKRLAIGKKYVA